nr:MAG TPA: Exonuclease VII, large subunit [Caudoviricetes sp.]
MAMIQSCNCFNHIRLLSSILSMPVPVLTG